MVSLKMSVNCFQSATPSLYCSSQRALTRLRPPFRLRRFKLLNWSWASTKWPRCSGLPCFMSEYDTSSPHRPSKQKKWYLENDLFAFPKMIPGTTSGRHGTTACRIFAGQIFHDGKCLPDIACQSLRFRRAGDISCLLPNQNVFHRTMKKRTPILDSSWCWEHGWDWKFPTVAELDKSAETQSLFYRRKHLQWTSWQKNACGSY